MIEVSPFAEKLRAMGMIRFHSSRLFMPDDKLMVGNWLEYRDMEAYETCNTLWQENGAKYGDLFSEVKVSSYRGHVTSDFT